MTEERQGTYRLDGAQSVSAKSGAVFLYHRTGTTWAQETKLFQTERRSGDLFGWSVAIDGDYAVVGCPGRNDNVGAVLIYKWSGTAWALHQTVTASPYGHAKGDRFGHSVKLSSTLLIVGAPGYTLNTGAVFVFLLQNGVFNNNQLLQVRQNIRFDF